ncbi:MAG: FAD-dependent oxidoreductase [Candidatus Heimdallarchaeota archaeon]|nr:MAG: FAD-dependent oxidoreductase [Candidatus Heimdallarchaeota archaeon]
MKVVVIGGNPAGLSAASAIRRIHADWEINVYEKDQYVSYGACGIPYYVSDEVKTLDQLITLTKEKLEEHRNIPVHLFHEVIKVDFEAKVALVKDLKHNREFSKPYDYLVIATGARAKSDPLLDIKHPRIFKVHTLNHAEQLKSFLEKNTVDSAVVIGTGYIGLEMLESYIAQGIKGEQITVIGPRLIFRSSSQKYVESELREKGVNIILQRRVTKVESISDTKIKVILDDGLIIETNLVQLSIGVVPATDMFKDTDLELLPNGAIVTNEFMQTNIPHVYAAGDCASSYHKILKKNVYIPLAPAANKQGRVAGSIISGKSDFPFPGVVGTAIYKVLDLYCASTGITEVEAKQLGYDAQVTTIESKEIAHYYPGAKKMSIQLVFDAESHLLLGAEITAPSTLGAKKIDVLATALTAGMRIDDIQKLDLSYAPPFAPVWDPILIAANVARKKCK